MAEREIYLNHAGTSWPKPQVVADAVRDAMTRSPSRWGEHFEQARHTTAEFFGIRDPDQLLLTPGCTSSLAVAIGDIDLCGRRRVLTSVWEHHAMHRPLLKLAESGVTVEYVPPSDESPLDLNQVEHQLSKGDVGLIAITAAANVTGDLLPFEEVIKLAHRHDAQVLLDAAQLVGWLDLDFIALGADLIAFGGHKGLQGPWGIGGLYVAHSARMNCSSATCELPQTDRKLRPGYCDVGSVDQVALAGLHAAIAWLKRIDRSVDIGPAREQIGQMEAALMDAGARCFRIKEPSRRMPTLAFSVADRPSAEIAASLKTLGIVVGSGLQCSPLAHQTMGTENEGLVRISVGIGQNAREIQAAIAAICELAARPKMYKSGLSSGSIPVLN
ncbi:MAG: cysteine desulfurase/selenocysteine lyase [Gammaproteobacteria bacterium]|jgi:cysteine desulfurase/selenocysteine lyase